MVVGKRYYVVKFKYAGKQEAYASSTDMIIDSNASYDKVQRMANEVALEALLKFWGNILPDEALPYLQAPEYVLAVPGRMLFVEEEER